MMASPNDLTQGMNALARTGNDITQVANYCSSNYLTVNSQRRVIDETMTYATQSLGTMIHQINQLATGFLKMLDDRTSHLSEVDDKVSKLAMEIKIRREKVARKAIGSLTVPKVPVKYTNTKLRQEAPQDYARRPVDYTILDHIGHGSKSQMTRTRKQSDSVVSPYGVPNSHAQSLSMRSSSTSHSSVAHDRQMNTMDPKAMGGQKSNADYAASSISSAGLGRYQSVSLGRNASVRWAGRTVGRTAGIYRTSVMGQPHILAPVTGSVQMMPPAGPLLGDGSGSIRSNSPGYASNQQLMMQQQTNNYMGNGSLGHSRRSSSLSGPPGAPRPGYAVGIQLPQPMGQPPAQPVVMQTPQHSQMGDYAAGQQQYRLTGDEFAKQQRSPNHAQSGGGDVFFQRQHSEPGGGEHYGASNQQGTPVHHFPNQYQQQQPPGCSSKTLPEMIKKLSVVPSPAAQEMHHQQQQQQLRQHTRQSMQAAAIDQLDSVVSMPLPPQQPQASPQPHQRQHQSISDVDISSLQPSPMDQLKPRNNTDPAWAPAHFIQRVITVYEYTADKVDELTFGENEVIFVIKKNDDGWWEGVMNGNTGLFPGNYVEPLE